MENGVTPTESLVISASTRMCKDISVDNKSTNLDNMNNITVEPQTQQMDLSVRQEITKKI